MNHFYELVPNASNGGQCNLAALFKNKVLRVQKRFVIPLFVF